MAADELRWISSSGGPLLLLPQDLIECWSGIDTPYDGRKATARAQWSPEGPATDYDRACDIDQALANIDVGDGRGIVLGGTYATAVWPAESGCVLVRWVEAENEAQILPHLANLPQDEGDGDIALIDVRPGPLVLFDAACPGPEVEDDKLEIRLHPGQYMASTIEMEPGDDTSLVLVPLRRVG